MSIEVMVVGGPVTGSKLNGAKFVRLPNDMAEAPERLVIVGKHLEEPSRDYRGSHYARRGSTGISRCPRYEWIG